MNKQELIASTAEAAGLSKKDAGAAIAAAFDVIAKELKTGNRVAIAGIGTFSVRRRGARTGRNPRTGETVKIKASKSPAFKPAKAFRDAI